MIKEFTALMNDIQDYRQHKANNDPDAEREYYYLRARIERTWRQGALSRMQMETLTEVMEEKR